MLIRVGAPPKTAFNQDRPISDLIRSQVEHLKHVEDRLTPEQRRTIPPGEIKTEAEAARYIAAITSVLQSSSRVKKADEVSPKVENIRGPANKAAKKHSKKRSAAVRELALAASAHGNKKAAKQTRKIAGRTKKSTLQTTKKTSGRATKKTAKKVETLRSRKKR